MGSVPAEIHLEMTNGILNLLKISRNDTDSGSFEEQVKNAQVVSEEESSSFSMRSTRLSAQFEICDELDRTSWIR